MDARYYGSNMGRFMSPDPLMATPERLLDPQEWNMYSYGRNNPLSFSDPTGLDIWLQGCGKDNGSTCKGNFVGTTDSDGNFSRTHLTGDQTGDASLGTNGISVSQGGNSCQGVWDTFFGLSLDRPPRFSILTAQSCSTASLLRLSVGAGLRPRRLRRRFTPDAATTATAKAAKE
jgi:uncharacterized protein RhaS with RHS repeats